MALSFEWDDAKARSNASRHGISFNLARRAFADPFYIDDRHSSYDGEDRFRIIGLAAGRVLFIVYTVRDQNIRLISAREAIRHEPRRYWNNRYLCTRT